MEKFLGVLFCGGRGKRLGTITEFISKSFVPVYDKPVFKFGLELFEKSKLINEILILTNRGNDEEIKKTGYRTIVQDDKEVSDMFTGWEFIKKISGTKKNGVLFPCDNICSVNIDKLITEFRKCKYDFLFSLHKMDDRKKLSQMGSFDVKTNKFYYRKFIAGAKYGVIAPYIIKNEFTAKSAKEIFQSKNARKVLHKGSWFDIGDYDSLLAASSWRKKNK